MSDDQRYLVGAGGPIVEVIDVSPARVSLTDGDEQQFTATARFSGGLTMDVTRSVVWSSDDAGVATVDSAGLATGGATPGIANVRATLGASFGGAVVLITGTGGQLNNWYYAVAALATRR